MNGAGTYEDPYGISSRQQQHHQQQAASMAQTLGMQWNPKHLEIKTRSVEKTLEPLVLQVTTLVSSKSPQKKKGKSKRAHVLVAAVERATANFVERGRYKQTPHPLKNNSPQLLISLYCS